MTEPLAKPARKNPLRRSQQINLPPGSRGRVALGLTAAAAEGRFALQVCADCTAVLYPPRENCPHCLGDRLSWREQTGKGRLIASTSLQHSNDLYFRERLPWRLGLVQLDAGPTLMVHLHGDLSEGANLPVRVTARLDRSGQAVLIALPEMEGENMSDDKMLREMASDPRQRKVLVTDGMSSLGQALVRQMVDAGAELIWVGHARPWTRHGSGLDGISALPQVALIDLDLSNERSVARWGAEIGGKVDILINNDELHRSHGIAARRGSGVARAEMDINYFGLLRLAQAFGPALRARAADGVAHACAWVNLLSIYALCNFPPQGTFSASKAAALSLSQCLRAEMQGSGIRVLNVFPGPLDDEWNQNLPPPKLAPDVLAAAILRALRDGVEDIYPGEVAQDWLARWRESPKVLERELAMMGVGS